MKFLKQNVGRKEVIKKVKGYIKNLAQYMKFIKNHFNLAGCTKDGMQTGVRSF